MEGRKDAAEGLPPKGRPAPARPKRTPDRVDGGKYILYYLTAFLYPLVDKLRAFTELDSETIEVLSL